MPSVEKVRGTQSFVNVMAAVWKRPSLSVLEILWRWVIGAPILAVVLFEGLRVAHAISLNMAALEAMTVFQPVAAFRTIHASVAVIAPVARPIAGWLIPVVVAGWLVTSALGRTVVLRRLDSTLRARPLTLLALGTLRAALLSGFWLLCFWLIVKSGKIAITGPAAHGGEADVVLYCALIICGTLMLYVVWGIVSWPLYVAPLLAMQRNVGPMAALKAAFGNRAARGKLVEINLVMNIVRISLIVLAMVFSASPLPFTSVETQTFLYWWWACMMLLYFASSDYFHVVRLAAYLSLWRAYDFSS